MIVDRLYEGESGPRAPLPAGVLRMSLSESCTRRAAYEFLGYEPETDEDDDRRAVVMQDGNLHEQDIVRRLLVKGFNIWNFGEGQTWVALNYRNLFWRGHPDLFMEIGGKYYGLDVKGFRDEVFRQHTAQAEEILPGRFVITDPMVLADGPFPVMGQMQLYLHTEKAVKLGVEEWIVVIKNKNTAELAECVIPKVEDYLDYLTERWQGFWGYITAQRLPKQNFEKGSIQCKMCPFKQQCWGGLEKLDDKTFEVVDEGLIRMAQFWREGKDFDGKAKRRLELSRLKFEQEALRVNRNHLIVDQLDIRVSPRERTGLDTYYVKGILDRLRREGHITNDEYMLCHDSTPYTEVRVTDKKEKEKTDGNREVP